MNISGCIYGNDIEYILDAEIKKREYDVGMDWFYSDFLWGVYNDKEKSARVK